MNAHVTGQSWFQEYCAYVVIHPDDTKSINYVLLWWSMYLGTTFQTRYTPSKPEAYLLQGLFNGGGYIKAMTQCMENTHTVYNWHIPSNNGLKSCSEIDSKGWFSLMHA